MNKQSYSFILKIVLTHSETSEMVIKLVLGFASTNWISQVLY